MNIRKWGALIVACLLALAVTAAAFAEGEGGAGDAGAAKTVTVNAGVAEESSEFKTIQAAIDHIARQEDREGWKIMVKEGEYGRFTILDGLNGLTVEAEPGASVTIAVCNDSAAPAETPGGYPDTAGVSIRFARGITLRGLKFKVGTQATPWYSAAVSNYSESRNRGDGPTVEDCVFQGSGTGIGVFINTGTTAFQVKGCEFDGLQEAISMYGDGTLMHSAAMTGNKITNCSFALHGYYGGTAKEGETVGTLEFSNNSVIGGETYCKVVIQDQVNTGALKADIKNNTLQNAIVGLVNLREQGETVSPVLDSNHFGSNSFYVEAIEPGTIEFYTTYHAPQSGSGHWELTGKEDFEVDWGKNPDGSTAKIEELVAEANASSSKRLSITGIDPNNLIKTFTWFKDGIYWVTDPDEPLPTPEPTPGPTGSGFIIVAGTPVPTPIPLAPPATGDGANFALCLGALAGAALLGAVFVSRRKER